MTEKPSYEYVGNDRRLRFESKLEPDDLYYEMKRYQKKLGTEFGIHEMLELEKIKAIALVAEAINDAPEFLLHQVGKARQFSSFKSITDALESVSEAIRETND